MGELKEWSVFLLIALIIGIIMVGCDQEPEPCETRSECISDDPTGYY